MTISELLPAPSTDRQTAQTLEFITSVRSISAVIVTRGEAEMTVKAIRSCQSFVDEIVVVDTGSRDDTVQRAQELGCTIVNHARPGYAQPRNLGAETATHDWVFFLEANEVVGDDLAAAIIQWKQQPELDALAFSVDRVTDFLGTWLTHKIDTPIRLYNKNFFTHHEVAIPATPDLGIARIIRLPGTLWYYGFDNLENQVTRVNRVTNLEAQSDYQAGKKFSLLRLLVRPQARFLHRYFMRGLFKRGLSGFAYALFWHYYDVLKELKLYEITWNNDLNPKKSNS